MYIEDFNIENKDDFLEKIARAKGNTSNCITLAHFVTKIEKIVKKIIKGDFYGIYRIIVRKFKKDNK